MMSPKTIAKVPGVLVLEDAGLPDGREFAGYLFGAPVSAATILARQAKGPAGKDRGYGEVVFNTSMTGYQEILTDPSYYGEMVVMTVPHVGNTGINFEDPESARPWCAGFIIHEGCTAPSNWRAEADLDSYLRDHGIPGLWGVDTRALTRHLRSQGVVRGVILPIAERAQARALLAELPSFEGRDLISEVTTRETYAWKPGVEAEAQDLPASPNGEDVHAPGGSPAKMSPGARYKVVALDYGVKWNLLRSLHHFGCDVEVMPAHSTAQQVLDRKPDGIFLSNGPGDPAAAPYAAETVSQLVGKVPVFGVCMGHQILALAMGAKTYKLKFGHRGGNQPVLDQTTQKVEISSHNHGYAVDGDTLPGHLEATMINLNDGTNEGFRHRTLPIAGVQFHPEASPGPFDARYLFAQWLDSIS